MKDIIFLGNGYYNHIDKNKEIWVCNDWYTYHDVRPSRIYQVHTLNIGEFKESPYRFKEWKKRYQEANVEIVCLMDLGFEKQRITKPDVERYGLEFYSSSYAYMAQDAIDEKVRSVDFYGITMEFQNEFLYQVPGILKNIDAMRKAGIKVSAMCEPYWRKKLPTVDWSTVHSCKVPYGSEGFSTGVKDACYNPNNKMDCPEIKIVVNNG